MGMKKILILVLILLPQLSFADELNDFQIEGISLGESLLNYFPEKEIKAAEYKNPVDKKDKYRISAIYSRKFKTYHAVEFSYLKNDKKYIIVGMSSALTGLSEKKFEDSYNKIVSDLKEFFPNAQVLADKPIHPWNKKTKTKRTSFKINPRDKFYAISAVYLNFPEDETRFVDNVGVTINTDEYNIYLNAIE